MYAFENKFKSAFRTKVRTMGWESQLIEVGGISVGVPDAVFIRKGVTVWVEFKNMKTAYKLPLRIAYRPGQQAWASNWTKRGGICCTLIATADKIIIVPFNKLIKDSVLTSSVEHQVCNSLEESARLFTKDYSYDTSSP